MKAGPIKQIALAVSDLDAAASFYGDTLGLPLIFKADPGMAFFDMHGIRLMLSHADQVQPGGPILYFSVDDCDKAYDDLGKAGANCIREPLMTHKTDTSELWLAFFTDPDGHTLGLMEERGVK